MLCAAALSVATTAHAKETLCDASAENCRIPLIDLINNETQGIDVGVWFFKDDRFVTALVNAWKRGVPMRIIMDPRANATYAANGPELDKLRLAGIPMRKLFAGQGVVEWSGANFSPTAFVPQDPYKDYEDEVIYFSEQLVPSFMTMFDNIWTNTREYANYANVPPTLVRNYPTTPLDPSTALPVQIYMWANEAERAFVERMSGAIIILLIFLMAMNITATNRIVDWVNG